MAVCIERTYFNFSFHLTDLIRVLDKEFLYYVPSLINDQPYRIFINPSPCRFKSFIK